MRSSEFTEQGCAHLLDYLVMTVDRQKPEVLKFHQELPSLAAAAKIDVKELDADAKRLRADLTQTDRQAKDARNQKANDLYVAQMEDVLPGFERHLEKLDNQMKLVDQSYVNLLSFPERYFRPGGEREGNSVVIVYYDKNAFCGNIPDQTSGHLMISQLSSNLQESLSRYHRRRYSQERIWNPVRKTPNATSLERRTDVESQN